MLNIIIYDNFMDFSIQFDTPVAPERGVVMGFGVFDGVHHGHRLIMHHVCEMAESIQALPAAVTFVPHPRQLLSGADAPGLLISVEERVKQLRSAGARSVGIINFTSEFAALEWDEFLKGLLTAPGVTLKGICVGEDWRFGKGGRGNAELLEKFCKEHKLLFRAVKRLTFEGVNISSSAIREMAGKGDLAGAAQLLGRELELSGTVVQGFRIAGKELAAPTANLKLDHDLMVPDGVYAGAVSIEEGRFPAVLNIGFAPTYAVNERRVEVHLLNFSGSLYGRKLNVRLLEYLRGEKKFSSPAQLKEQITRDIARASVIYNKTEATQEQKL
ncbi:MAG: riboflavin biosynthesis protein RibF [Lentisphaeria bacterium]|nr:riboflavin biosynthesis protein RibF [Lentisphaeria bacterium]